jgi:hypothetical protein
MMHVLAATEAAAFRRKSVMEQFIFLVLRNLPLKRPFSGALGEIGLMGYSKGSWKRLCNSSPDIRATSGLGRDSPKSDGYYVEASHTRALTICKLGHPLHISTVCT